jgi:hypothetical protein
MSFENTVDAQRAKEEAIDLKAQDSQPRWWLGPVVTVTAVVTCLVASFAIYHHYFATQPTKFVVVDLHRIIDAKEIEFTAILSKPGVGESERVRALALVADIEPQLKKALVQTRAECGCEILVKAAALTSDGLPDLTPRVAEIMKISDGDFSKAKDQLQKNIASITTPKP